MPTEQSLVAEMTERIMTDLADPRAIIDARGDNWQSSLWETFESNGLSLSWVPEALGGAGVSLAEGFEVASMAGRFALSVPLVETMLAGWLLTQADIVCPAGAMAPAPVLPGDVIVLNSDGTLTGRARAVPFARQVAHLAVLARDDHGLAVALVATSGCRIGHHENVAGDPRDDVVLDKVLPIHLSRPRASFSTQHLLLMGGVMRSLEIAAALQSALALSVDYAAERIAFGRPIGKFQAVQINLARLAGEVAAAAAAAGSAADAIATTEIWDEGLLLETTSAKIRCAEAAGEAVAIAHQVHGAIGVTDEHVLHRYTLRALAWRDDFGSESYWAVELGNAIAARGPDALWPLVASR
ncbi:MAG: acrC 2 [Bradyrhizobium sp.]|nr:acrC 2 [Bradyrhizobium sp.]